MSRETRRVYLTMRIWEVLPSVAWSHFVNFQLPESPCNTLQDDGFSGKHKWFGEEIKVVILISRCQCIEWNMLRKRLSTWNSFTLKIGSLKSWWVNRVHRAGLIGVINRFPSKYVNRLPWWQCGLRPATEAAWLMRSRVRIHVTACTFVSCVCCALCR